MFKISFELPFYNPTIFPSYSYHFKNSYCSLHTHKKKCTYAKHVCKKFVYKQT